MQTDFDVDQQEIINIQETENKCFNQEVQSVFLAHQEFLARKEESDLIIKKLRRKRRN